jgi:flagellar M-ring protein FliF
VDGTYSRNDQGESTYQPRTKEELDRISALVRTAIGFDQGRGDQVEVVNLRFAEQPVNIINEPGGWMSLLQFTKAEVMRGVELGIIGLLGLLVLLLVVRPLVRRVITPETAPPPAPAVASLTEQALEAAGLDPSLPPPESKTAKMIDIAQVKGQVHAQSVQKVGELAEKNPNETVAIIRHWLHDAA